MSLIDKWLKIHRADSGSATSATFATSPNTRRFVNDLDVASGLLPVATSLAEAPNVASCSRRVATKDPLIHQSITIDVAEVADVAEANFRKLLTANVKVAGRDDGRHAVTVDHDGRPPREWTDRLIRLRPDHPPGDVPLSRWRQVNDDCRRPVDRGLAGEALGNGWTAIYLFGCNEAKPFARIDQMGLVWFIKGGRIISMSMSAAIIETPIGARHTYRRKMGDVGQVEVWELFGDRNANERAARGRPGTR